MLLTNALNVFITLSSSLHYSVLFKFNLFHFVIVVHKLYEKDIFFLLNMN